MSPFNNNSHSCNTRQRSFRRRLFAVPLVGALTIGALMGTADATAAPSTGSSGSSSGSSGSSTGSADLLGGPVDLVIGSSGESTGSESTGSADGSLGSAEIGTPEQRSTRASRYLFADPADRYIVVLGAKIGTLGRFPDILLKRLDLAARLSRQNPLSKVVVTGGDTWWLPVSEAQFMNVGMIRRGVPPWRMLNEDKATSTVQNADYTVQLLKKRKATGAVIVTNDFHMDRALKNFRDAAKTQKADMSFIPAYAGD